MALIGLRRSLGSLLQRIAKGAGCMNNSPAHSLEILHHKRGPSRRGLRKSVAKDESHTYERGAHKTPGQMARVEAARAGATAFGITRAARIIFAEHRGVKSYGHY